MAARLLPGVKLFHLYKLLKYSAPPFGICDHSALISAVTRASRVCALEEEFQTTVPRHPEYDGRKGMRSVLTTGQRRHS